MNNERRKAIGALFKDLTDLAEKRDELITAINDIKDEEQESYDALPPGLQDGTKGQDMQASMDSLEQAADTLEAMDFDDVTNQLQAACGK